MGINNLLPQLNPHFSHKSISNYAPSTIGIDGHVWLHNAVLGDAEKLFLERIKSEKNCGAKECVSRLHKKSDEKENTSGRQSSKQKKSYKMNQKCNKCQKILLLSKKLTSKSMNYPIFFQKRLDTLLSQQIKVIIVFDGLEFPSKRHETEKRREKSESAFQMAKKLYLSGDKQYRKYTISCLRITREIIQNTVQYLKKHSKAQEMNTPLDEQSIEKEIKNQCHDKSSIHNERVNDPRENQDGIKSENGLLQRTINEKSNPFSTEDKKSKTQINKEQRVFHNAEVQAPSKDISTHEKTQQHGQHDDPLLTKIEMSDEKEIASHKFNNNSHSASRNHTNAELPQVRILYSPYESDAQLAFLQSINVIDHVLTEDSDLIVHGCKSVLYKLKDGMVEEYNGKRIMKMLGIKDEHENGGEAGVGLSEKSSLNSLTETDSASESGIIASEETATEDSEENKNSDDKNTTSSTKTDDSNISGSKEYSTRSSNDSSQNSPNESESNKSRDIDPIVSSHLDQNNSRRSSEINSTGSLSPSLSKLKILMSNLLDISILSGCDYLENIPQLGINRVIKYWKEFSMDDGSIHNNNGATTSLSSEQAALRISLFLSYLPKTFIVPPDYLKRFIIARNTFLYEPIWWNGLRFKDGRRVCAEKMEEYFGITYEEQQKKMSEIKIKKIRLNKKSIRTYGVDIKNNKEDENKTKDYKKLYTDKAPAANAIDGKRNKKSPIAHKTDEQSSDNDGGTSKTTADNISMKQTLTHDLMNVDTQDGVEHSAKKKLKKGCKDMARKDRGKRN